MTFKTPILLLLIPVVLLILALVKYRQRAGGSVRLSSHFLVARLPVTWKVRLRHVPDFLRIVSIILFLIALAGPRTVSQEVVRESEGIDIVLAIDISGSMAAEDFKINGQRANRLAVVKNVVAQFIEQRTSDRIGLIAFASLAYTVVPLTTDYSWLEKNLEHLKLGLIEDGTAVGSAIASSVSRLKASDAKSKVVILLTDGVNNAGKVDPLSAARAADVFGIKIYTIGAGTNDYVPYPVTDFFGRKGYRNVIINIDEATLQEIAKITDGRYFRATDTASLKKIYDIIDKLEKVEIEKFGFLEYTEYFDELLWLALALLLMEILLSNTIFLKLPY